MVHVSERVIDFRAKKSMAPDDYALTQNAQQLKLPRRLIDLILGWQTNKHYSSSRADQSKEEEFINMTEVREAYTGIYK